MKRNDRTRLTRIRRIPGLWYWSYDYANADWCGACARQKMQCRCDREILGRIRHEGSISGEFTRERCHYDKPEAIAFRRAMRSIDTI